MLHPEVKKYLEETAGQKSIEQLTVEENRQRMRETIDVSGAPQAVAKVEEVTIPVEDGTIQLRIYTPEGEGPFPVLVYFHGGGWVLGDLDVVDRPLRAITNLSGYLIVSVDYRLAPEHRFPTAPLDCYAAVKWVAESITAYNGNPDILVVGGDSAGGNLAAVVTLMAREKQGPDISYQILIYPGTDFSEPKPSYEENGEGYGFTKKAIEWYSHHYLRDDERTNPLASPLLAASHAGLPPALVITAEYDPYRDEGELYAARLQEEGVPVEVTRYEGMIHGFFRMTRLFEQSRELQQQIAATLTGLTRSAGE